MRSARLTLASLFVAALAYAEGAHAQGAPIDKCTGNFEEAQLKEKRGKLVEAEQLYAACADAKCPSMIRTDCSAKRDEVLRRIPTVSIVVRDASGNDVTAYVEIDGKPLVDRAHAQPVDPGEHVVDYRAEGKKPAKQKITVVEGEKARVITLTAPATANDAPAPSGGAAPDVAVKEGPSIVGPAILVGAGIVLLGAGVLYQVLASNEDSKAAEFRARANDANTLPNQRDELDAAASSRTEAANNNQIIALVAFTGGGLFLVGGVTWYLLSRSAAKSSAFAPMLAPGLAGASYGFRF